MKISALILFVFLASITVAAQGGQDWRKMSVEDAVKILTSSPWGQIQTDTDISEMFFTPTRPGTSSIGQDAAVIGRIREQAERNNTRADRGALNQAVSVSYHVRFFSARPVREALSRIVLLDYPEPSPVLLKQWQEFIERDFGPYIVITVTAGSPDGRMLGPSIQALNGSTVGSLRNNTYLERNDGKRVYLVDYRPPGPDGLGAKFIFPRMIDKERYLTSPKGSVRFVSDMGPNVKLNVRFNLSEMVLSDRLEY